MADADCAAVAVTEEECRPDDGESPGRPQRKTPGLLAALRESRRHGHGVDKEAISTDEYFLVRLRHVALRVERVRKDLYDAEATDRAAMHAAYKDATFDLLWEHRQRQKRARQQFEDDVVASRTSTIAKEEALARQALMDLAVKDFDESLTLEEHRRKERVKRQHADLREAVLSKAEQDAAYALALDHADQVELLHREEARGRDAILSDEDAEAREAWAFGVLELRRMRIASWEARGRERVAELEAWEREVGLRALQLTAVVANAEAFYRGKIAEYEEPRKRDVIEQKWLRERDFIAWQAKARHTPSKWAAEDTGDPLARPGTLAASPARAAVQGRERSVVAKRREEIRSAAIAYGDEAKTAS